jgi:YidC/Oxa1 family membrane protein insertase
MAFNFDPSGKNNPQDTKNIFIFVVAAIVLWMGFDHFLLKPREEAVKQAAVVAATAPTPAQVAAEKIIPRDEALTSGTRLTLEAPEITGTISTTGIRFDDVTLKNYYTTLEKSERVVLFSPTATQSPHYADISWISGPGEAIAVPGRNTVWQVKDEGDLSAGRPIIMSWDNGQGLVFDRIISVDPHYMFTVTQRVTNTTAKPVTLYPYAAIARRGLPTMDRGIGYEGPLGYFADDMHEIGYDEVAERREISFGSNTGWIGFGEKYWLSALIPDQASPHVFRFSSVPDRDPKRNLYQVDVRGEATIIPANGNFENTTHLFVGAKKVSLLDSYGDKLGVKHFDLAVDFGVLYFLTRPLYFLLNLFHGWVGNFGLAILMITLTVRAAVFPLANKSYRSFAMLKKVAPAMAELKLRYGQDKPRLQQELIKLYERERVNPMAGCLPLLLQIPIFFAVYKVISISIEMRHAPFFGWIQDLSVRDPLSVFNLFGLLPYNVPGFLMIGVWSLAMLGLMLIQKHMNPPPQDQIQKDIANYMPWVVSYVLASFPSGLVIYWTFSNVISVIQQYAMMRMLGVPVYLFNKEKSLEYEASHVRSVEETVNKVKSELELEVKQIKDDVIDAEIEVKEALFGDDDDKKKDADKKDDKK